MERLKNSIGMLQNYHAIMNSQHETELKSCN